MKQKSRNIKTFQDYFINEAAEGEEVPAGEGEGESSRADCLRNPDSLARAAARALVTARASGPRSGREPSGKMK